MLTCAACLWDPTQARSASYSRCYDEDWARKLYRGFERNLTVPWRFVLFTDRFRKGIPGEQERLLKPPGYGSMIEPFRLDGPLLIVGLDTVITGNLDQLADYAHTAKKVALPKAIYRPNTVCNGVAVVPPGSRHIYDAWNGENDMQFLRTWHARGEVDVLDDIFPGLAVSYRHRQDDARIVFFHGNSKPHLMDDDWIKEHWK